MAISNTPSPLSNIITAKTYNAAWFSGSTKELQITNAIAAAALDGALYVYVPANMLPYNAALVVFNGSVQMIREGSNGLVLDVRAYGAAGTLVIDDTVAIQAAFTAAIRDTDSTAPLIAPVTGVAGSASGDASEVVFPQGKYKITSRVTIPPYCKISSDDNARIVQYTAGTDIFYGDGAFRVSILGIVFLGGRHAIYLRNNNLDTTSYLIDDCEFHAQEDYSIRFGDELAFGDCGSALASIDNCGFYRPNKVLFTMCDHTSVNKSWAFVSKSNFTLNTAAFINKGGGDLVFNEMFGVPTMAYGGGGHLDNVRWVDNYGNFFSKNSRFGGEDAGMQIVRNFRPPETTNPWLAGAVIDIRGGYISAGPSAGVYSGVIGIGTDLPQMINIEGVQGINTTPLISNAGGLNLTTYLAGLPAQTLNNIRYYFDHHLSLSVGAVPAQLLPYFLNRVLAGIQFPVSPVNSADLTTLDDYSEGPMVPIVFGSTLGGTYELAASTSCWWQKIGNKITVFGHIVMAAVVTGGGTGNVRISGMPVPMPASPQTGTLGVCSVNGITFTGSQVNVARVTGASTSVIYPYGLSNAGVQTEIPIAQMAANRSIDFVIEYTNA